MKQQLFQSLAILTIFHIATAQRPSYNLTENQRNRAFFWSSTAPMTRAINELTPEAIPFIELVLHHASRVENAIITSLHSKQAAQPEDPVKPCNPQIPRKWLESLKFSFGLRGLVEPVRNCASEIYGVDLGDGDPGYTLDDLYDAVFNQKAIIQQRLKEVSERVIDNFTTPELVFNFSFNTSSVRCTQSPACLFRQNDHWSVSLGIHNVAKDAHVRDGDEVSVLEFMRVVNGSLGDNLRLWLPVYDNGSIERVIRNDATTMIQRWSTAPNPSCFREIPMTENPAVVDALDQADHFAQQAEDALARSNLAILLLPLGLNIIPIALIADVERGSMLLYTILSDVLTVIPLAIKGVELLLIGEESWRSVVTRMTSHELGNGEWPLSVGGEIWAAECRVRQEVRSTGVVLLVVSIVFLIIGVVGEVFARWYVNKVRRKRVQKEWWEGSPNSIDVDFVGARDGSERYSNEEADVNDGCFPTVIINSAQ